MASQGAEDPSEGGGRETWTRPDSQGPFCLGCAGSLSVASPVSCIIWLFSHGFSWPLLCFLPGSVAFLWFLPPSCCAWRQPKGLGQEPCWGACVCALTGGKHQH